MMKILTFFILLLMVTPLMSQKKAMTPEVYNEWNRISDTRISNDGNWIAYSLSTEIGDKTTILYNTKSGVSTTMERSSAPRFDAASSNLIIWRKPAYDHIRQLKLKDTKKDDLPGDTLMVYSLSGKTFTSFPEVKSMEVPEKWGSLVVMHLEDQKIKKDSLDQSYTKKEGKDNGTRLIIADLKNNHMDTIWYVLSYEVAEENPGLAYVSNGIDSMNLATVYKYDLNNHTSTALTMTDGKYSDIAFSEDAQHLAFIADLDTSEVEVRPYELMLSVNGSAAKSIVQHDDKVITEGMMVSEYRKPRFSKDNSKLYFGIGPEPLVKDTTKLDEELPGVEVWYTDSPMLYTQQEVRVRRLKEKNYMAVYHINSDKAIMVGGEDCPDIVLSEDANENLYLGYNDEKYMKTVTWTGNAASDVYFVDGNTGKKMKVIQELPGDVRTSPDGKFAAWYNIMTQDYYTMTPSNKEPINITASLNTMLADEENDSPREPYPYGIAGWTTGDQYILIYDRYDIWKVDPTGKSEPINLTNGRKDKIEYRYINLDRDEPSIDLSGMILLRVFDENDKTSGFAKMLGGQTPSMILKTPHVYSRRIWKAKNSNDIIYTRENFDEFPDLVHSDINFSNPKKISNANPQQNDYLWGSGELYEWTDDMGIDRTGMFFVPEGFDPNKKYPMLVNFYEKSSDGIYRHRAPYAHRSTINYTYYLSKGYVIFNPDVDYEIGYPGRSAYNASVSGTLSLIEKGFIDKDRIALQGHSWGGYQNAHILTKTDMFRCAEAGAPVVNMVSAYGGIRWGSGMSRMFQYEKTQSRLGKTLWENPGLYLENSPIFNMDKMNTPVLILHNDNDGAVPWYQGIEYFVALRRLNKPAWLLNYNNEPHWPLKWPNRLDFNIRMEQFFDHYLMDAPMPEWMKNGIPAHQKKTNLGY
ncbi:MAG: S9 family peptidase [Saprospiraceae bacterium]|nr:S9 family peptidase [Saprospiraceae bacterium]